MTKFVYPQAHPWNGWTELEGGTLCRPVCFHGRPASRMDEIVPRGPSLHTPPQWWPSITGWPWEQMRKHKLTAGEYEMKFQRARCAKTGRFISWEKSRTLPSPMIRAMAAVRSLYPIETQSVHLLGRRILDDEQRQRLADDAIAYRSLYVVSLSVWNPRNTLHQEWLRKVKVGTLPISTVFDSQREAMKVARKIILNYGHDLGYTVSI